MLGSCASVSSERLAKKHRVRAGLPDRPKQLQRAQHTPDELGGTAAHGHGDHLISFATWSSSATGVLPPCRVQAGLGALVPHFPKSRVAKKERDRAAGSSKEPKQAERERERGSERETQRQAKSASRPVTKRAEERRCACKQQAKHSLNRFSSPAMVYRTYSSTYSSTISP